MSTVRDAYQSAVRFAGDPEAGDLKATVLTAADSRCLDKHSWYDSSKARVKEIDAELLRSNMKRRLNDPKRAFSEAEYDRANLKMNDHNLFTIRWLTRATKQHPLGEHLSPKSRTRDGSFTCGVGFS